MVFINKALLTVPGFSIPAPLFITSCQTLTGAFLLYILGLLSSLGIPLFRSFTPQTFNWKTARHTRSVSISNACMLGFNSLCLYYVEVSFYPIARSLLVLFSAILTYSLLHQPISRATMITLVIIVAGFVIGSNGEVRFSFVGTFYGMSSSFFVALTAVLTSTTLRKLKGDKGKLVFYSMAHVPFILFPISLLTEFSTLWKHHEILLSPTFWGGIVVSGTMAVSLGSVIIWQVQVTSPLSSNVSSAAKSCVQTIIAYFVWKNVPTFGSVVGLALMLLGTMSYAQLQIMAEEQVLQVKYKPIRGVASRHSTADFDGLDSEKDIELDEVWSESENEEDDDDDDEDGDEAGESMSLNKIENGSEDQNESSNSHIAIRAEQNSEIALDVTCTSQVGKNTTLDHSNQPIAEDLANQIISNNAIVRAPPLLPPPVGDISFALDSFEKTMASNFLNSDLLPSSSPNATAGSTSEHSEILPGDGETHLSISSLYSTLLNDPNTLLTHSVATAIVSKDNVDEQQQNVVKGKDEDENSSFARDGNVSDKDGNIVKSAV